VITHEKELTSITQTGATTWDVKYTITVSNDGGASGTYGLSDAIANYTSDAPANANNPGPTSSADFVGPWTLASLQDIVAGGTHTYCITFCVDMDLNDPATPGDSNYDECGANGNSNDPEPGEGLYNSSHLDLDDDGMSDENEEACGDLPHVFHEKSVSDFHPMPNGNHMVTYEVCVYNDGGADGQYDLYDWPQFDDDITIVAATYNCTPGGSGALTVPPPAGGWLLVDDQNISPGNIYCCMLEIEVDIDLSPGSGGDQVVDECGTAIPGDPSAGEALYNESLLDVNNDGTPDEMDEACRDVFMISHEKTLAGMVHNPDDSYCLTWNIVVENMGSEPGFYDLYDWPQFDPDFQMLNASYSSTVHVNTTLPIPPPAGGWQIANDINLVAYGIHIYTLDICVFMDLEDPASPGDMDYTTCGETNMGPAQQGEGLFNETLLDINDDGTADEMDEVCVDIPYVTHDKDFVDAVIQPDGTYDVTFKITVDNIGGATGDYDLWDLPQFDNDFVINSAEFTTDAAGHTANPGPDPLTGVGPWDLADDQSINAGETQCYFITVNVTINLSDPATAGDEIYTWCGTANGAADPEPGEGFYNESYLDRSNDGTPEEEEETCGDVEIVDLAMIKQVVTQGPFAYGDIIEMKHTIYNQGNIDMYNIDLVDYLPAGFGFAGVPGNSVWVQSSPTQLDYMSIPGPLAPTDSVCVSLFLEVLPTMGGASDWWNYSEISGSEDEDGNDRSDDDVDSDTDDDPNNDNQPEPDDNDDDEITEDGDNGDEDDVKLISPSGYITKEIFLHRIF